MEIKQIKIKGSYTDNEISRIALENTFGAISEQDLNRANWKTDVKIIADICKLSHISSAVRDRVKEVMQEYDKYVIDVLSSEKFTKIVEFESGLIPAVEIVAVFE